MATLLGDMRSEHSQWSREASRNCLAADLYLVGNTVVIGKVGYGREDGNSVLNRSSQVRIRDALILKKR